MKWADRMQIAETNEFYSKYNAFSKRSLKTVLINNINVIALTSVTIKNLNKEYNNDK